MVNLAVIGAGVGGCSAAYFAQKFLSDSKVTVYETKNRIGGRIFTYHNPQIQKEIGAEFFNQSNKIVSGLVAELNLQTKKINGLMNIAVWNGNEFVFQLNQSTFRTMLSLVTKHKLSIPKLLFNLKKAEHNIKNLYKQQNSTQFNNLFQKAGLDGWYKRFFDEILLEHGVDQSFVDDLVTPITRLIYTQNAGIAGFAGLVALLGVYSQDINKIKNGNQTFPQKLLKASNANVKLKTKVNAIEKLRNGTYHVHDDNQSSVFDAVIVAAPLEVAKISFDGLTINNQLREYQTIHTKIMKGQINPDYFNLKSSNIPSLILTSKKADPITLFSIKQSPNKTQSYATVTSTKPLPDNFVDELFKNGKTVFNHTWHAAYPVFKPIQKIPEMNLDQNLLYLNGIESAASTLETSAFAALNAVKNIKKRLG